MWLAACGYEPRAIVRRTPAVRLLIVLTLPPRYRCPLNRLPAPRFLLPRSGLEHARPILMRAVVNATLLVEATVVIGHGLELVILSAVRR
jgi:hypothetical protein